jgi:hypothetical protein
MKNVIKHSKKGFLMVTLFATLLSFANDASIFNIKNRADKKTALTLRNVKAGNLLSIKDNNGIVLYKESIEQSGIYNKGFDLTSLPDGKYLFELEKDIKIKTVPFIVKSNKVELKKDEEIIVYKPYFRVDGDLLYITKLTLNDEPVSIDIYFNGFNYTDGLELMHSEKIVGTKIVERAYRLSGLDKGDYKAVVKVNNREYQKYIKK